MAAHYAEGVYAAQILQVAFAESSNNNPMIQFKVKVIGTVDAAGEMLPIAKQYDRTVRLTMTDKSHEMCIKKLRWAGWNGTDFKTLNTIVNSACRFVCSHRVIETGDRAGEMAEDWDFELPPLESKPLENDPSIEKRMNALFGKVLKNTLPQEAPVSPNAITPEAPEAAPVGGPPPDDEVPF